MVRRPGIRSRGIFSGQLLRRPTVRILTNREGIAYRKRHRYGEAVLCSARFQLGNVRRMSEHGMLSSELKTGTAPLAHEGRKRFYRPELDLLRFFAFFLVFLTHGPRLNDSFWIGHQYNHIARTGVYGLSLFFFLSSYLITELLLQEKERTGRIHLKAFYIRRILRIWPLYFAGLLIGVALSEWNKPQFGLSKTDLLYLVLFVGYIRGTMKSPIGHLWSISVEELFYAIWPVLSKLSKVTLLWISFLIFPISLSLAYLFAPRAWY